MPLKSTYRIKFYQEFQMKLSLILKSLLDHFFEINKIDLVVCYLSRKTNNRKEVRKFIEQLDSQDPLYTLLMAIFQKRVFSSIPSIFFPTESFAQINLKRQMKEVFISKVRNNFMVFQSATLFLSTILFTDNLFDTSIAFGTSILKILLMYYLTLPALLHYIAHTDLLDEYIKEKISCYNKLLSPIDNRKLQERCEELTIDDYKHLFFQMNHSDNKEIPSLKYLTAFYIKNNTDIDVNGTSIPEEVKEYVNHL